MAGVRQHGWRAIPAVRSEYGADTLPDRYRSDGRCRSAPKCTANNAGWNDKAVQEIVRIPFCQTIITVITEGVPLIQYIAERFAQSGFFRQRTILLHHPFMQRRQ